MIRIVTAAAFALTIANIAAAVVSFVTGWWILGIVFVFSTLATGFFTAGGMSVIVLEGEDD